MPASQGTPTVFDKARVALEALFGKVPAADQATLAGEKADLQQAITATETLFGPTLQTIETDAQDDVTTFLKGVLSAVPSFTSLSQAVNFVVGAAAALGGPISGQITSLEKTALTTVVGAGLVAVGHVNVPIA